MPESLGARLRRRREEQNIALVTIAEQTKIKLSLLEGLERDDVSHWPSGIFRRAYLRTYAHAIGLDPDAAVREFLEVYPEPAEVVETAAAMALAARSGRRNAGPPTRFHYIVGSAIGSLSRLRRGSGADRQEAAESASTQPPAGPERAAPAGPELASPAHPVPGHAPLGELSDVAADHACGTSGLVAESALPPILAPSDIDFMEVARLCTEFGRVETASELQLLLHEAAGILDATGLIVWVWDPPAGELRPALVDGYSDTVLAQLPAVRSDADNATAVAFRSAQTCTIDGNEHVNGALVVPLVTPAGCAGVLAIELQRGSEQKESVRAAATILAALLSQLIGGGRREPGTFEDSVPAATSHGFSSSNTLRRAIAASH